MRCRAKHVRRIGGAPMAAREDSIDAKTARTEI
jgi:hypothetical protein